MDRLNVDTEYLIQLADEQDQSAAKLEEAIQAVDGTAMKLWFDHGPICYGSVSAMVALEEERAAACSNMLLVTNNLAESLRLGAGEYDAGDAQSGAALDGQVVR